MQKLLAAGENARAEELLPMLTGDGDFGSYLLLCDAVLDFTLPDGEVSSYRRCLDLDKSLYSCGFTKGGSAIHPRGVRKLPRKGHRVQVHRF